MKQTGRVAGRLSDWVSLGVLASWVDRDAVDYAVEEVWTRLTETLADWGGFGDD